jgi:hypothetical protein
MKYLIFACILAIASPALALGRRSCSTCNVQHHAVQHVVHQDNVVVIEKQIVVPQRITRYREIPGLRIVEGSHGEQLILAGNKVLNTESVKTSVLEEINPRSVFTERIITKTDFYGNRTVTVEKEISK